MSFREKKKREVAEITDTESIKDAIKDAVCIGLVKKNARQVLWLRK